MANEDKATRYHRLRRRASLAGSGSVVVLLMGLMMTGGSAWLGAALRQFTGESLLLTTALYVTSIVLLIDLVQLPFAYYQGMTLEQRYGLGTQTAGGWWLDRAKASGLGLVLTVGAALVVWGLMPWMPVLWWVVATAVFAAVLVGLAQVAPVLLLPLFYTFAPLQRPELVERLLRLAHRARADIIGVFEWRLGDRTRKANAALAGLGRTRRILLSDTLLADHSDDEIEVILAHELAHHVHGDIWKGLALEALVIGASLYAGSRALVAADGWFGLTSASDIAGLPVLALTAGAVSLALAPAQHAMSRAHERRADRYALEMTRNAAAFISAMKRLSATNLAEEQPSRVVEWLFHSHPSTSARIAAASRWPAGGSDRTRPTSS